MDETGLRIVDLPEGGGAAGGNEVWFRVVAEDGSSERLRLRIDQYPAFLFGLDRFYAEARRLRAANGLEQLQPLPQVGYKLQDFQAERTQDQDLILRFKAGGYLDMNLVVPKGDVKALLAELIRAIGAPPSAMATPGTPEELISAPPHAANGD